MEEIWKKAKGLEERLLVSSKGRVFDILKNRLAKQFLTGRGYYSVTLWYGSQENRKNYIVSRLVAQAFIPNPNNLPQVNHKDGNKLNNCVDNLEWVSARDNNIHAIKTGLRNYEKVKKPILQIKNGIIIKQFSSLNEASRETGIDTKSLWCCANHKKNRKSAGGFQWEYKR